MFKEVGLYETLDEKKIFTDARHNRRENLQDTCVVAVGEKS